MKCLTSPAPLIVQAFLEICQEPKTKPIYRKTRMCIHSRVLNMPQYYPFPGIRDLRTVSHFSKPPLKGNVLALTCID